ncbi:MAG TPA: ABA4-like family protein [Allosphingosinicella sp.]|nr:ABA4-like family protein [Allosphingosinicella sp.]
MSLETWFWLAHVPAAVGWIVLLAAPAVPAAIRIARLAAAVLALGYLVIFVAAPEGLATLAADYSLAGIGELFSDPRMLLLGWVHYLAFDIWVASWEVGEGRRLGMPHWLVAPCLFVTFMVGPLGLLLFLAARAARSRRRPTNSAIAS